MVNIGESWNEIKIIDPSMSIKIDIRKNNFLTKWNYISVLLLKY